MDPQTLLYAESHEWVHAGDDGVATIGISAHAVEALTDLVYMELPDVGTAVSAGDSFGVVESVKATSDLFCPVDGEVIEANTGLPDNLEILSEDPYEKGWIIKVKMSGTDALSNLMNYEAYEKMNADGH